MDVGSNDFEGEEPTTDDSGGPLDDIGDVEEPASDKPFEDEPFDAEIDADEEKEPKNYIQQLSGKLGQSLRTFTQNVGMDLELEKFAINSLISATHSSQMDAEDQEDIIKKIKDSGSDEESEEDTEPDEDDMDDNSNSMETTGASMDGSSEISGDGGMSENNEVLPKEHKQVFVNAKLGVNEGDYLDVDDLDGIVSSLGNNLEEDLDEDLLLNKDNDNFDDKPMKNMINDFLNKQTENEESPVVEPETKPKPATVPKRVRPFRPRPNIKPVPKGKN